LIAPYARRMALCSMLFAGVRRLLLIAGIRCLLL
jgi:hypothetical protein